MLSTEGLRMKWQMVKWTVELAMRRMSERGRKEGKGLGRDWGLGRLERTSVE